MSNDFDELRALNIEIGDAESRGDAEALADIIAPALAFARADGKTIDDRQRFLEKVEKSSPRETKWDTSSIEVLGSRAIVKCLVTVKPLDGPAKSFHNVRIFVKLDGHWRLLGWANEPSGI